MNSERRSDISASLIGWRHTTFNHSLKFGAHTIEPEHLESEATGQGRECLFPVSSALGGERRSATVDARFIPRTRRGKSMDVAELSYIPIIPSKIPLRRPL